jgi:hypothetical protein
MTRRHFVALLAATLVFRFWLAAAFPMSGDEAYFVSWGLHPDWGYYDHPPMVGWWLAALLQLGSSLGSAEWWLRLPAVMLPAALALAVHGALPQLVPGISDERRYGAALLVLLAPVNVWNVFITTDTPLIYFSVFSALAWLRAAQEREGDGLRWYGLAGILLAGAVLSKYFAAILGFAFLIDVLRRRTPRAVAGLVLAYACTVPALVLMAWWNSGHCWTNYLFNFVNRHGDSGWSVQTPLLYAATLLYMLTPPVLWLTVKHRRLSVDYSVPALGVLAWVPFALFAVLSLVKQIGLHWLLSFVPFTLLWIALRLPPATLRRVGLFFAGFAALHIALIVIVSRVPLETWQKTKLYDGIVLTFEHDAMARELAPYRKDWVLAMEGYSNAATLAYNLRSRVIVFGEGSSYARQDDLLTDFSAMNGRNILILRKSPPQAADYVRYFNAVSIDSFTVRGAQFWRIKGEGFNYPAYRDTVLTKVRSKYYAIPPWLPHTACYICDRYFPGSPCQR